MKTHACQPSVLEILEKFVQIGSPTFAEQARSQFIRGWLNQHTNFAVQVESSGSVWVDLSHGDRPVYLLDAHIDTVFPDNALELVRRDDRWCCPGIIDDGAACALLMEWIAEVSGEGRSLPFIISFTTGEEGFGNLVGIREVLTRLANRLVACWHFDLPLSSACRQALGSMRYRVKWQTAGGHSWLDFGRPNAIHLAANWICDLERAFPWENGHRTFNVGRFLAGSSINVLAECAEYFVEARSHDAEFLEQFHLWMLAQNTPDRLDENVVFSAETVGKRPAGELPESHKMVAALRQIHEDLHHPLEFGLFSTNSNASLSCGIPALTTGLVSGGGSHTRDEFIELSSIGIGQQKLRKIVESCLNND